MTLLRQGVLVGLSHGVNLSITSGSKGAGTVFVKVRAQLGGPNCGNSGSP